MPRAYWKGHLKLSLVTCPVEMFPASSSAERTHFHRINKANGHRLKQQMIDADTGRVVPSDKIGRGYELTKGSAVEIDEDELQAVQLESTHTIEIDSFVPWEDVDRRYLAKSYYLAPGGKHGLEAFVVIRDAMKDKGKVALGRVVLAHREHVLAIEPLGKGLLATTLHYPYEMRDEREYFSGIKPVRVDKEMIALAGHILDSKSAKFDPSTFDDRYENALKALVKRKAKGKTIEPPKAPAKSAQVIDLFQALRQSLGKGGAVTSRRRDSGRAAKMTRRRKAA